MQTPSQARPQCTRSRRARRQPGTACVRVYEPLYWPPLTAPVDWMYSHGVEIIPPPQPFGLEQKHTSWAERGVSIFPFVAMHMRSDAASAPPKAQQQPHMDWSRLCSVGSKGSNTWISQPSSSHTWINHGCVGNKGRQGSWYKHGTSLYCHD